MSKKIDDAVSMSYTARRLMGRLMLSVLIAAPCVKFDGRMDYS
jgi:hypothetical protein